MSVDSDHITRVTSEGDRDVELSLDRLKIFQKRIVLPTSSSTDFSSDRSGEEIARVTVTFEAKANVEGEIAIEGGEKKEAVSECEEVEKKEEENPGKQEDEGSPSEEESEESGESGESEGEGNGNDSAKQTKPKREGTKTSDDLRKRVRRDIEKRKRKQCRDKRNVSKGKQKNAAKYACKDF